MNGGAIGRALRRRSGSTGNAAIRGPSALTVADLARRIEEVGNVTTEHAQAYIDYRLSTLPSTAEDSGRRIEARARLASQEAKAYADSSIGSLSMALRGMSRVVLGLSRRVQQIEGSNRGADAGPAKAAIAGEPGNVADLRADLRRIETMVQELAGRLADLERRDETSADS